MRTVSEGAAEANADVADLRAELQRTMSRDVAVVRDAAGLDRAAAEIDRIALRLDGLQGLFSRDYWEVRNLAVAASELIAAAAHRHESRGAHYRSDFPTTDPALDGRHSLLGEGGWRFGALADALDAARAD